MTLSTGQSRSPHLWSFVSPEGDERMMEEIQSKQIGFLDWIASFLTTCRPITPDGPEHIFIKGTGSRDFLSLCSFSMITRTGYQCKVYVEYSGEITNHWQSYFCSLIRSLHCKKSVLKIQEYIHEGANLKFYIPEFFNFKLLIPENSPI
jgi:hypothetical protein